MVLVLKPPLKLLYRTYLSMNFVFRDVIYYGEESRRVLG